MKQQMMWNVNSGVNNDNGVASDNGISKGFGLALLSKAMGV